MKLGLDFVSNSLDDNLQPLNDCWFFCLNLLGPGSSLPGSGLGLSGPSLAPPRPDSSLPDVNHAMCPLAPSSMSKGALIFLLILQSNKLRCPTLTKVGPQTKKVRDLGLEAIKRADKML